ncbi:L-idonate 5-dehydrogenase [Mangrovicoccus algicola]|uniref:L-idonate 5-dehydrogenase n=1 Tax=Mangrovicoccus algicola TaxID=2771008 RepID=A0A8J6YXR1_9RHOB|nr:L-idonate 5-dehydrogenase [Mangrovicoccus algicola]MBE3638434.1 L-idonate 5-dehydrogenase [Mangrovicoccus algicola]
MKALYAHGAKDLRLAEAACPRPGAGEVRLRIRRGGICGSDLHYYSHGGFGTVKLREPMILGHEVAGEVIELGEGVTGLAVGDLVAVSPSRPCGGCGYCLKGLPNQCENMRFYGSAMPFPHIQGAFRQEMVALAAQCVPAAGLDPARAALAEPLSVALHAVKRAGDMLGRRVLVTGCGPIGVLAILAARAAGAGEITAVDISDRALGFAATAGATRLLNTAADPQALEPDSRGKGSFDVLFECSGAAPALAAGIGALAPRGVIVQLGMSGEMTLPILPVIAKELEIRGSFRFHEEFALAVAMMQSGRIDPGFLLTHTLPLAEYGPAFETAADKARAMKVQLDFA